jgi:hypothetical protein
MRHSLAPLIAQYLHVPWSPLWGNIYDFYTHAQGREPENLKPSYEVPPYSRTKWPPLSLAALSEESALVVTRALLRRYPTAAHFVGARSLRRAICMWWPRMTAEMSRLLAARQWVWGASPPAVCPDDAWAAVDLNEDEDEDEDERPVIGDSDYELQRFIHVRLGDKGPCNAPYWLRELDRDVSDANMLNSFALWVEGAAAGRADYWATHDRVEANTPVNDVINVCAGAMAACDHIWRRVQVEALLCGEDNYYNDRTAFARAVFEVLEMVARWTRAGPGSVWMHCSRHSLRVAPRAAVAGPYKRGTHVTCTAREWPPTCVSIEALGSGSCVQHIVAIADDAVYAVYRDYHHGYHHYSAEEDSHGEHHFAMISAAAALRRRRHAGALLLGTLLLVRLARLRAYQPPHGRSYLRALAHFEAQLTSVSCSSL